MNRPLESEFTLLSFGKLPSAFFNYGAVKGFGYIKWVINLIRYISQGNVVKEGTFTDK